MWGFEGRPVLVTGASGGIGGATVRQLVAAGADVIASGRSKAALDAPRLETGCRTLAFDLTSEESVRDALEGLDLWGVVNCGGFGGEIATPMDTDIAVFDQVISVNARGALLVIKYALAIDDPRSARAARSSTSRARRRWSPSPATSPTARPRPRSTASPASRRSNSGKYNIRVNSVNPTVVMTDMSAFYWGRPDIGEPFLKQMPLGRWATEDEIAAPIVFLLGDGASMISGVSLPIDGGFTSC